MKWLWHQSRKWTLVSSLLRERVVGGALLGMACIYLVLSFFEVPLWICGWRLLTDTRCPGCGLTTGCKAFLRGYFLEGVQWNWLTPLVILGLLLFAIVFAMPKTVRSKFLSWFELLEGRGRLVLWVGLLAILQTVARIKGWA